MTDLGRAILLAASLFLATGGHVQADSVHIDYRRIADALHLRDLLDIDPAEYSMLQFRLRLTPSDPQMQMAGAVIQVRSAKNPGSYVADRFGGSDFPFTRALYDENPKVSISQGAASGLRLGVDLLIRGDYRMGIGMRAVRDAVDQYASATRLASFKVWLFAPRLKTVLIRVQPGTASACIIEEESRQIATCTPNAAGECRLPLDLMLGGNHRHAFCLGEIENVLLES